MRVAISSARDGVNVRARDTERGKLSMLIQSTLPLRFWRNIYADPSGCWLWRGTLTARGYGSIRINGPTLVAHRLSYEVFKGAIPEGLELDHRCRVLNCVNPRHLEAVTHAVNCLRGYGVPALNARKTHCPAGHPYDLLNTYRGSAKRVNRKCRTCRNERRRRARESKLDTIY